MEYVNSKNDSAETNARVSVPGIENPLILENMIDPKRIMNVKK
jgi:hypothetical protein